MSNSIERRDRQRDLRSGAGVEALRRSSTFRGPVEPIESHDHSNDHLALLYESRDEQFAAVVPFIRDGLERGERCLYIADETPRETVLERLRDAGVDVDEALESGALEIHTVEETYMEGGTFDLEESLSLLEDEIEAGLAAFDGFRVTAEETWLLRADDATEDFMALESRVNDLLEGTDATALCQYDRERFPASVLHTVIKTHPHLVYGDTVSQNFYYTPPEAFFGDGDLDAKVDRMMRTLRDRTEAKAAVREHERYLRALYETTADGDLSFEERVERLLELGCERFDLRGGALAHLPTTDHNFRAEVTVGPDIGDLEGELPIQPTEGNFCRQAIECDEPTAVPDVVDAGWGDDPIFEEFGFGTYFGIRITVGTEPYGTFWFYDTEPREEPFTEDERTFLELMGQWISTELGRRRREEFLRRSYEITSDPELAFEEKVERLLEHGRQWFGFDIAYLSEVDVDADAFEVVDAVGSHERIRPGVSDALSETYCREVIEADGPTSVRDAVAEGWEGDPAYETYGLDSHLGTTLKVDGELYGTLCFGSATPRAGAVTDTEYTFLELISQWVCNELERRRDKRTQRELYEITSDPDRSFEEKVEQLLDLGRERFDLDMGFFLEKEDDRFRVVKTRGTDLEEGVARLSPNPGNYCKQTITVDVPVGVEDVEAVGWDDDQLYREYGLGCYLGTKVTDGDDVYGSVCFADGSSLDREFTDAEYTFLDLLGQWLSHELEQREREVELRKSKEQFERIFENSHDAIYINDPRADEILDANEAGCEMLGYSYEELVSRRPSKHHPDEMEEFRAFVDEVYETGSGWTDELTCLHRDGTRIPVEMSASTIEYDGRQCMLAIVRDITDRKERERELERAERQFEAVFNNPVSFVGLLDPDGTLRRANENALEFVGVDESDVRGEKFWETPWFTHSEAIQRELRDAIDRAANGEYVQAEIPHESPDGDRLIMDSMLEPVLDDDGEVVAIVPSGHDITELRERERAQRRLYEITADPDRSFEEKLRAVLDLGCERFGMENGGLAVIDPADDSFEVEIANAETEYVAPGEEYPLSETYCHEVVGDDEIHTITDPEREGFTDKLCYRELGDRSYIGTRLSVEGEPDRSFWFVSSESRPEGFSEAERTFMHLMGQWVEHELERRVYERDLEETVDRLQQSNDRLKQFAYAASHDLQEPLRMVSSYLQLLENRYRDELDADAREFIDFAVDGADRMRAMVDDLLAFSRVEHADGEFEPVDCERVLEHVIDDLQVRIAESDAEVVVDDLPTVVADGEQLAQLFSNLVANGIKYNESAVPRVEVTATDRGDRWEFAVDDNGIGIEPEKRERIFEVFKRLHHDDEYPGTGIGLSLCQEIADNHGGDIRVESERGEGSTFYVTLPKRR